MKKRTRDQSPKTGRKVTGGKKRRAKKRMTVTKGGAAILETGFRNQEASLLQGKLHRNTFTGFQFVRCFKNRFVLLNLTEQSLLKSRNAPDHHLQTRRLTNPDHGRLIVHTRRLKRANTDSSLDVGLHRPPSVLETQPLCSPL